MSDTANDNDPLIAAHIARGIMRCGRGQFQRHTDGGLRTIHIGRVTWTRRSWIDEYLAGLADAQRSRPQPEPERQPDPFAMSDFINGVFDAAVRG